MKRFDGKDMKVLNDLLEEPKHEDPAKMHLVWESVGRVIKQCWEGINDCSDRGWRQILYWLSSASKAESNSTPFSTHMDKKTRKGYTKHFQRFMMFVLRGSEDPNSEYGIEYTGQQSAALDDIKTELEKEDVSEEDLDQKVLTACLLFIKHSDFEKQRSALLYFTGVVGFHMGWKRWRGPAGYTSILAGLQWVIRLLILESAVPMDKRENWFELYQNDPLKEFKATHSKCFLTCNYAHSRYLVEGESYPYAEIHELMNYGMKSSINVTARSRVSWSADEKVLYRDGKPLKMRDWKKFVHQLLGDAEKMLSKYLLFRGDGKLPGVDLHSWNDNSNNHQVGHYFALEGQDALERAQQRMMQALNRSSRRRAMENKSGGFNSAGVKSYKHWDTYFRRMMAILISATCGLSGRGKEMTSMRYMNTMKGDRNFLVEDGQFRAITEYHKSQAITDSLKVLNEWKELMGRSFRVSSVIE